MNLCQLEQIAIEKECAEIQLLILSYIKEHRLQDSWAHYLKNLTSLSRFIHINCQACWT